MKQSRTDNISTSKLLSRISGSKSSAEVTEWHDKSGEPTLGDTLYYLMEVRKLSPKEMIQKCRLERSYFYHILSGKRIPSRNMILRIGLCLDVSLTEMERLLRLSHASDLYAKIRRDALLIYAISNHLGMEQANRLLLENGELPLYRTDQL